MPSGVVPCSTMSARTALSTSISSTPRGQRDTRHNPFRAPLEVLSVLRAAGFDLVSVANNHSRDFGAVGYRDMLTHLAKEADVQAACEEINSLDVVSERPMIIRIEDPNEEDE